jgi:hypothetical protein
MKWYKKGNQVADKKSKLEDRILDIIKETPYVLKDISIDYLNFGNVIVTLSRDELVLRFIQDRDFAWSEFGFIDVPKEWVEFETALEVLGIKVEKFSHDLIEVLKLTISFVEKYYKEITGLKERDVFIDFQKKTFIVQKNNSPFWNK